MLGDEGEDALHLERLVEMLDDLGEGAGFARALALALEEPRVAHGRRAEIGDALQQRRIFVGEAAARTVDGEENAERHSSRDERCRRDLPHAELPKEFGIGKRLVANLVHQDDASLAQRLQRQRLSSSGSSRP